MAAPLDIIPAVPDAALGGVPSWVGGACAGTARTWLPFRSTASETGGDTQASTLREREVRGGDGLPLTSVMVNRPVKQISTI